VDQAQGSGTSAEDLWSVAEELSPAKRALLQQRLARRGGAQRAAVEGPRPRGEVPSAPLSYAQRRLWLLDQLHPGLAAYNVGRALRLRGALDVGALEWALSEIVVRHAALRTAFVLDEQEPAFAEEPVQRVLAPAALSLAVTEARGADRRRIRGLVEEEVSRPFDLAAGRLLRGRMWRLGEGDHLLVITTHHIASDEGSKEVLFDELAVLYDALRGGRPAQLPELELQYGDYAAWERARMRGPALEAELGWWRIQLEDAPAEIELPSDRPRLIVPGYRGARLSATFDERLLDGLRGVARAHGVTLFMVLLAGFQTLLARWTGQDDVTVGAPSSGRTHAGLERLVGLFSNTLVLRCDLSGDPTFSELLARTRESAVGAYAHVQVPFDRLVEELAPARELARHPLFQVMFNFLEQPSEQAPALGGLEVEPVEFDPGVTKFDLALVASVREDGLRVLWEYSSELFERGSIVRLTDQLRTLLEGIVADPQARISRLAVVSAAERRELLEGAGAAIPQLCVHELIERQASARPDALAVECDGLGEQRGQQPRRLSYGELRERANRVAHELRSLGVGPGTLVGVYLDRSVELVVGLLGVLKAGAAYVPLDPEFPPERLAFMVKDAGVGVLVTRAGLREDAPSGPGSVVCVDDPALERHPAGAPSTPVTVDDLAYVIYTSGSTGEPKGVMVEHRSLVNLLTSMATEPGLDAADVLLALTTFSFDIAAFELLGPLTVGGRVVIASDQARADPDALLELLGAGEVTIVQATPSTWRMLIDAGLPASAGLRAVCGGEALAPELAEELCARIAHVWNFYGPTETTVWSTCWKIELPLLGGVPIGQPIANTSCRILDPNGELAPPGALGELHIGGAGVARGYHERPQLTSERFIEDPFDPGGRLYRTGDLVRLRPDGLLEFRGRRDQQVKLRGFRVELGEIEATLARHPRVHQALAHIRADASGDQLLAYVVGDAPVAELLGLARRHLPEYMVPSAFVSLPALPLTPNGKLDRAALPAPEHLEARRVAPRTALERRLAGLWAEVLGVQGAGVHDSFFALGGHSLSATRLVARINSTLGARLPMRAPFEAPTIAQLAELLERKEEESSPAAMELPVKPLPHARESAPASFQQRRLWFLDRLAPNQSVYNIPLCLRIVGSLDVPALRRALDQLVARHDALRVSLVEDDGSPVQVIAEPRPFALEETKASSESEGRALAQAEAARAFDLASGPLARGLLIRLAEDEHILALTLHHAVADGWSLGLLADELGALYKRAIKLAPPELQYSDYALLQSRWLQDGELEGELEWWRAQLAGAPAELELPTDRPRPARPTGAGARHADALSDEVLGGLQQLAGAHEVTLFMVLVAALNAMLARCSGQEEIVLGAPVSGRARPELEGVFGYLANTLVLRCDLSGDPTFSQLLARVRETALGAYAHQEVPFDKLVEELAPARDLARHPLFQVLVALQDDRPPVPALEGAAVELLDVDRGVSRFDLSVSFARRDGALRVLWEYSSELFDEASIVRLAERLKVLLEGIVADPQARVSALPLLSERERHMVLEELDATGAVAPSECVHELFERQVAERPDALAVQCGGRGLSYGELDGRANRLAHELRELGVGPGSLVGLYVDRSVELLVGLLGVLKAGGAYVPLDPGYPAQRLAFMVSDAGARVLVTREDLRESAPAGAGSVVCVDDPGLERRASTAPPSSAAPEDLAYVIYTSGSTGAPKGVMVEHRSLMNLLASMATEPGLKPGETMLGVTTPAFDLSVPDLYLPLITGASLLLARAQEAIDPRLLAGLLDREQVTLMQATPSTWQMLLEDGWTPSRPLRIVVGGEAVPAALAARLYELTEGVWNFYGPTETTVWSTCWRVEPPIQGVVPIGRPIANTRCYVLDRDAARAVEPAPIGVLGELYIGGAGVARGYHDRAELTAERFLADPFHPDGRVYRTGDIVRLRSDGLLEFNGRRDQQVKLRGFRIELGEIDATLALHSGVTQALTHIREDTPGEQRLVAYFVGEAAAEELRELARARLPEHMVPGALVKLDALPLTPNGKLDRAALPKPVLARAETVVVGPRTPLERHLAELWSEVLGVHEIGVHDNFFALGGHSLLITKMLARVRQALGIEVPLRRVYEAPTIAELAEIVSSALIDAEEHEELELLLSELERRPDDEVSEAV
jgi:amino acid adenylation domain-containing protein